MTINGGGIDASATVNNLGIPSQTWNNNWAFNGSNPLTMGSGSVTLGGNIAMDLAGSTLTIGGAIGDGGHGYGLTLTAAQAPAAASR